MRTTAAAWASTWAPQDPQHEGGAEACVLKGCWDDCWPLKQVTGKTHTLLLMVSVVTKGRMGVETYMKIWGLEQSFSKCVFELYQIPTVEMQQLATLSLSAKMATNHPTKQKKWQYNSSNIPASAAVKANGANKSQDLLNMSLLSDQITPNFRAVLKELLLSMNISILQMPVL